MIKSNVRKHTSLLLRDLFLHLVDLRDLLVNIAAQLVHQIIFVIQF
jgi:hypothetical protein